MAFNPFNLFKGNPKVLELMGKNEPLETLLMEESFVSQFKRSENEALQSYMNYEKYEQLIKYITVIDPENINDKNKSYRFPFMSADILAVSNEMTFKYLLQEVVFTEEEVEEEVEVEKQIDSESDRSYSSIKSNNSNTSRRQSRQAKSFQEDDKQNFVLRGREDKVLDDYLSQDKQISEDDFPDVVVKKRAVVKQMVKRTKKKPFEPLIFQLLRYFQEKTVIHILDGYLSKVIDNVVTNKLQEFLSIVQKYHSFGLVKHFFQHIDSSSVQELLLNLISKIIELDSFTPLGDQIDLIEHIQNHCLQSRKQWEVSNLPIEDRIYYLDIYSLVIQKITSKAKDKAASVPSKSVQKQLQLLKTMAGGKHIEQLIMILTEVIEEKERVGQFSRIVRTYLKILKNILSCFLFLRSLKANLALPKHNQSKAQQIAENCEDSFDCVINLCFSYLFEDYLLMQGEDKQKYKPHNSLTSKLEFLDIVCKLAEESIYFSRTTIIDNPYFDHLLKLMDLYPHSSIFHNSILCLVTPFLNSSNDLSIINKLFLKRQFFKFIYLTVKIDYEQRYEQKQKSRCCYIAQIVSICMMIQKMKCEDSEQCCNFKQSQEWQFLHQCLLEEEKGVRQKILGGLEKQNERKPIIFFSKQESLSHFRYFLSGVKYNSFDQFENYEPGNSDSEDEADPNKKYDRFEEQEEDKIKEAAIEEDQSKYFDENIDL